MTGSFPIKITTTIPNLPTQLSELESLTKESLESTQSQLPQKVNNKTLINGVEVTGNKYITNTSKTTFKSSTSDLIDLSSVTGDKNKIYSNKGDDFIFLKGNSNTTDAGEGNDTLLLSGNSNAKTNLGSGNDLAIIVGSNNQIGDAYNAKYNEGNDSVAINGNRNQAYLGNGNDISLITGENNTLDAGSGDDKIAVSGTKNTISTYTGNDIVSVEGTRNTINSDRGDDEILVKGDSNIINSSLGNDNVKSYGKSNSIQTGDGNDQVTLGELTEGDKTYTASGGFVDLGSGDDTVTIELVEGNFTVNGGKGTNTLKLTNIDFNQYYGTYDNKVLELFKANGTGNSLKINLSNVQSVEFSGTTTFSLEELKGIQGKTIQLNSSGNVSSVTNQDGKSNVLQLDFDFDRLVSVNQTAENKYNLTYIDNNSVSKNIALTGIFHLKTGEGLAIDLTRTPNFKTIAADITNFQTSSVRQIAGQYNLNVYNPTNAESYNLDVDTTKDSILTLDNSNPSVLKNYSSSALVFDTYGNSTAINPGVINGTVFSNSDQKTNVADFSGFNTENIHRIERLKLRDSEDYFGVTFSPTSPYYSTLPDDLIEDVTIDFDGVSDIDTIVNAYNLANPTRTITHNGVGTTVLSAGSVSLNNTQTLNNQYRVIFEDGGEKSVTLDRYSFIKTKEGHNIHIESLFDSLKGSLNKELANIDPLDPNYDAFAHDGLKNTQFARGAYNVLSAKNDPNKYDALIALAGATYNLLPETGHSLIPVVSETVSPAEITPSTANLIDGDNANFYSSLKKNVSSSENFILDLGAPTQFSKIQIDPRADFDGLFPTSFNILAGNDVNSLTSVATITATQAKNGYSLSTPITAKFIKFDFNNKQLSTTGDYYAEIGEVKITDPSSVTTTTHAATISDFSSQDIVNVATNAIDGNNTTYWKTTDAVSQTTESILLDLSTSKSVNKLRLRPASGATNYFPTDISIYAGDDPFNLTLKSTITNYNPIDPLFNDFSFSDTTARYVKINAKSRLNGGVYSLKLAEISVIGNTTPVNIPTTVNSTSSSETANSSTTISRINDGDVNTFYSSDVDNAPTAQSITFDLGSTQTLQGFNFTARTGYEGLFPTISNIFIDNNPTPITAVTGLAANGTNFTFNAIAGRYIKVDFTSNQDGSSGNYYSQIAEAEPVFNSSVNNRPEVNALADQLLSSINFSAKESDYEVDAASKALFALRTASLLRNRSDVIDKIKQSGLTVSYSSLPKIDLGTSLAEGVASFQKGSQSSYEIQLTSDSFFAGTYDNEDGIAVDIHELVHVLDFLDDTVDGNPVLINGTEKLDLGTARNNLFAPLNLPSPLPPLGEGLLYSPGVDDPTRIANAQAQGYKNSREFLAYSAEVYLERADELVALGADGNTVYEKLRNYFGLNTNVADPDNNVFTNSTVII